MGQALTQEEIVKIAAAVGVKVAQKYIEDRKQELLEQQKNADRRLHNTQLLLKNYRKIKVVAMQSNVRIEEAEETAFDIISMMSDRDFQKAEATVYSIERSVMRTAIIYNHINRMVETYKIWCERSGKDENLRHCRVLFAMYLNDKEQTVDEIAAQEGIVRQTVYRDLKIATEHLSALIFGIDSIK